MKILLSIALALMSFSAVSGNLECDTESRVAYLQGRIDGTSVRGLIDCMNRFEHREFGDKQLIMSSAGGEYYAALRLAEYVQKNDILVAAGDRCNSACSIVFASAHKRLALMGLKLGLHAVYDKSTGEPIPYDHEVYVKTLNLLEASVGKDAAARIFLTMLSTPPEKMTYKRVSNYF